MSHVLTLSVLHLETKEILIQFGNRKMLLSKEQRPELSDILQKINFIKKDLMSFSAIYMVNFVYFFHSTLWTDSAPAQGTVVGPTAFNFI